MPASGPSPGERPGRGEGPAGNPGRERRLSPPGRPLPARRRRLAGRVALVGGALLLLPFLAEGALRLAGISPPLSGLPLYEADDARFFRGVPHAPVGGQDAAERLDTWGYRNPDRPVERRAGQRRILVAGDSFVFGLKVSREEALPARLETLLPRTEVWNLGLPSYTTVQEAAVLRREVPRLRPDAVILAFFMGNDWFENLTVPDLTVVGGRLVLRPYREALARRHALAAIEADLVLRRHSHLYALLVRSGATGPLWSLLLGSAPARARVRARELRERHFATIRKVYGALAEPAPPEDPVVARALARTFEALNRLATDLRRQETSWILAIVPDLDQVRRSLEARDASPLPWAHERLRAWAEEADVSCLDLLAPTLASPDPLSWYEPGGHWSAAGHAQAARALEPGMRRLLHIP